MHQAVHVSLKTIPGDIGALFAEGMRALSEDSIPFPRSFPLDQSCATPPPTRRILPWLPHEKSASVNALYLLPVFLERGDWRRCGLAEQAENDSRREHLVNGTKADFREAMHRQKLLTFNTMQPSSVQRADVRLMNERELHSTIWRLLRMLSSLSFCGGKFTQGWSDFERKGGKVTSSMGIVCSITWKLLS